MHSISVLNQEKRRECIQPQMGKTEQHAKTHLVFAILYIFLARSFLINQVGAYLIISTSNLGSYYTLDPG